MPEQMPKSSFRVLALVTDAFGGHGGIAQYNRHFLSALAACEGIGEVIVLPRAAAALQRACRLGVRQLGPRGEVCILARRALDRARMQAD